MKALSDLLKTRPKKQTYDPPIDVPLDQTTGGAPPYDFPPELIRELAGKTEAQISSTLSKFRTRLSEHRTHLSEHRTDLSEHRTDLSDYRTELSQKRTEMSEHRTDLSDARTHMANERTLMASVRTAVALLSFGITLNRFSITLEESNRLANMHSGVFRDSANIGLGMVILGVFVLAMALWRHLRVRKQIETLNFQPSKASLIILSVVVLMFGALSTVMMLTG